MAQPQFVRPVVRFLGSLTFLIILLSLMLVALILPTIVNVVNPNYGYDSSVGALRRDWYGAWWFNILMALLMVNLTVCTIIRVPWRYFWQWGFLITHSGILTLMIGAAVTFNLKIYGDLRAFEGQSYDYFTIENENELVAVSSEGGKGTFDLRYNPYRRSTEWKTFRLPSSKEFIRVQEYLPNVAVETSFEPAPAGSSRPVVELGIQQGDQPRTRKFLVAGEESGDLPPLLLLAMPTTDEQFLQLAAPAGEDGLLTLTIDGVTQEIDLQKNKDKPVAIGTAEVTVRDWGDPSRGNRRGYWAEFDLRRAGGTSERWSIQAFDTDHPFHKADGSEAAVTGMTGSYSPKLKPAQVHGPQFRGALYLCKLPSGLRALALGSNGDKQVETLAPGQKFRYPFMPIPLEFELVCWMDSAQETVEPLEPKKSQPRNPALRVTVSAGKESQTKWVKFFADAATRFTVGEATVDVHYQGRQYRDLPFSVGLDDFRVTFNRGARSAKHFESDLTLTDHETGVVSKQTIEVNTPMKHMGFVIYQSGWHEAERRMSILQISKDPGKKILYLGWIMAVSGSIFMFFLKPFLQKLIKAGSKGSDVPLRSKGSLAIFGLVTLGTILGMLAPLVFPSVDALWLGLAVGGVDLVLALGVAVMAKFWMTRTPVRALQVGEILSAGWCLNTAALVILLMMKVTA